MKINRAIKDYIELAKYIKKLNGKMKFLGFNVSCCEFMGRNFQGYIEELDAVERELNYIDELMEKTKEFKKYYEFISKGKITSSRFTEKYGYRQDVVAKLNEETFYLVNHIKHYEEEF